MSAVPRPSSPPSRGLRPAVVAVRRSLRAMDGDRRGALAAAVAMLIVLATPWYEVVATATGADGGRRTLHQSLSGWQALSVSGIVCALVAVAVLGRLLIGSGSAVEGLGAAGRRAARSRVDGALVAAGGALSALLVLVSFAYHPGPHPAAPGAHAADTVRFGLVLALLVAIALGALGGRILLAAGAADVRGRRRQPAPGRTTNENSTTSMPTSRMPSTISQRRRVM